MPEWMKTGAFIFILMVCWDVVRLFLQAYVNKRFMKKDFDDIDKAIEDLEED